MVVAALLKLSCINHVRVFADSLTGVHFQNRVCFPPANRFFLSSLYDTFMFSLITTFQPRTSESGGIFIFKEKNDFLEDECPSCFCFLLSQMQLLKRMGGISFSQRLPCIKIFSKFLLYA